MLGPSLHKIQGYQGHRNVSTVMSANAALITMETYICTTRGNNLKTSFSHMSQNVIFLKYILGYLWGPERVFNDKTGPISGFPAILSPISMYMSNKETI